MAKTGVFKAKAILESVQWGEAGENNSPQIAVDLNIKDIGRLTTFLFFTTASAPYSFDRLRAMGWKGQSAADLHDLTGIDTNEVDVEVTEESYNGKMQTKVQILTGSSRVTLSKPVEAKAFAAKVAALLGNSGSVPAASAPKTPF